MYAACWIRVLGWLRTVPRTRPEFEDSGRRKLNAGLIDAFFLKDEEIVDVQLTGLYSTLSHPTLVPNIENGIEVLKKEEDDVTDAAFNSLIDQIRNPEPASNDDGSRIPELVELIGLEPNCAMSQRTRACDCADGSLFEDVTPLV